MLIESYPESILCKAVCTSSSPECCWVIRSWQNMGKITSATSTNATACCSTLVSSTGTTTTQTSGILGVTCSSTGIVTEIKWHDQRFVGSIPPELWNLTNLQHL